MVIVFGMSSMLMDKFPVHKTRHLSTRQVIKDRISRPAKFGVFYRFLRQASDTQVSARSSW